jgi:lipid-binding SYLF domain-containing protein
MFDRRLILILLIVALTFSLSFVMGQNREEVQQVQSSLKEKGYDPGPIDGVMGPMTRCALQVYQRSNDLQATGRIDDQTRAALGIGDTTDPMATQPGQADTDTQPGRADDPDFETQPETQPDWETQPGTQPDTDMDTQPETQPDWETQPGTQPDTDMDTQPETQPDWETQPETQPDTDRDTEQPGTQPGTRQDWETDRGTEPGTDYDAQQPGTQPGQTGRPDTDFENEHGQQPGDTQQPGHTQPGDTQPGDTQPGMTQDQQQQDRDRQHQEGEHADETERVRLAAEVLREMTQEAPDHDVPRWLMERARAIAVIPNVTQAALGIGGRWGNGLITARGQAGEWSAPAFISLGGASVGLQAGVERSDVIMIFTDEQVLNRIVDGRFELGADVQVAAGPVGREAAAGVDADLEPVYTYSRSRGLFAGASLEGAVINLDEEANQRVYGQNATGRDLLINRSVQATSAVQPFLNAVQQHVQPVRAE